MLYHIITSHHITSPHHTTWHITLHHITSHHITSHHIISHHIISYHIISYHITSYSTSRHITSHHIISYHIISYHIAYHIVWYHIITYCITAYHTIQYHIISTTKVTHPRGCVGGVELEVIQKVIRLIGLRFLEPLQLRKAPFVWGSHLALRAMEQQDTRQPRASIATVRQPICLQLWLDAVYGLIASLRLFTTR